MTETVSLNAEPRDLRGKGAARRLRMQGRIPAVVYGRKTASAALSIAATDLERVLSTTGGDVKSTLISLAVGKQIRQTLIREIQRHPFRPEILHVDFYEIQAHEKVTLEVPIHLVGNPDGVRNQGGVLDQVLRELQIQVLPHNIPEHVSLDVTDLSIGHSLHVRDIVLDGVDILSDPDATICSVIAPRVEAAPVEAEAAVEEGEAEPEVIGKVKTEEESGEEES